MREADKPALATEIWKVVDQHIELPNNPSYVLDGGNLLFMVKWKKGSTFEDIFKSYVNYVLKHYGPKSVIVFDGYPETPTTKDTTHLRRKSSKAGRCVNITPHTKLNMSKESFMSVLKNKHLFNKMLTEYINTGITGLRAHQENGDADYLIAQTAITNSKTDDVVVISADTDILVLLIHLADSTSCKNIFLTSSANRLSKSPPRVWDIFNAKQVLGIDVCKNILEIHAFLGCDTTSRIHGIGKGVALKKFQSDEQFRANISVFSNSSATENDIAKAGESVICMFYGEKDNFDLNELRYSTFCKKISTCRTAVLPENLPPTSESAKFHSMRVFHQVQTWKGISLNEEHWGWVRKGNYLLPKLMIKGPAPPDLLKLIKCNCKTGCSSGNCSCKKNNLKCTVMCGFCKGLSCFNHQDTVGADSDETSS